jgi:hypothetical protein
MKTAVSNDGGNGFSQVPTSSLLPAAAQIDVNKK